MTEGVPQLTGLESDPMLKGTKAFPGPGGTIFRLVSYPPKRPEGWKPPPGVTLENGLTEMSEKIPRMGDHFERDAPGMHTSDTLDYGIVVRGEMTLELDDGQTVHLRQGDLARAKPNPTPLAQPVAGALSHGLHLGWRKAWLRPWSNDLRLACRPIGSRLVVA